MKLILLVNDNADGGVLPREKDREEEGGGGFRTPSSTIWRGFSSWRCKTEEAECSIASQPHICTKIKGLHLGKIG